MQAGWYNKAEDSMREAIALARTTNPLDIPVGALVLNPHGSIIGRGTNRREADNDPLAHAEVLAIREAVAHHGDRWRLSDCTLVVTLEPCTMCAGAILAARLKTLYFGAYEPKTGACGSVVDVLRDPHVLHKVEVRGGILESECQHLLTDFFQQLR